MMMISTTNYDAAEKAIREAESILLVTHVFPDGDAIGSLLGLANSLRALGKDVTCAVDGGCPDFLDFLPGSETIVNKLEAGEWDLMISVDASDEERTGQVGVYGRARSQSVINLDHHATNTGFGDIHLVQPDAVSASQVVLDWIEFADFPLSREVAAPLLTGFVTDTLGFRTSNVTTDTLAAAQRLMHLGASLTEITARTLDNKSYQVVNLWKYALATVELSNGVVTAEVRREHLKKAGLSEVVDGGLVGFLIRINEAMIAAVFKETPEGNVEMSFRSKPGFDVGTVALGLGGGGHKQAAGATIPGPMETARSRVMPLLIAACEQGQLSIV